MAPQEHAEIFVSRHVATSAGDVCAAYTARGVGTIDGDDSFERARASNMTPGSVDWLRLPARLAATVE